MKKLIMLYFFLAGGIAANTKNIDYTYLKMQSAPFEVDDDYLSKLDFVYFSPSLLEAEVFPMGNGDIGGMVWNHDNGIELQINKNDLWIGTDGNLSYYSYKENRIKTIPQQEDTPPIRYIHSICEVNDSTLWLATTGNGLLKVTLRMDKVTPTISKIQTFPL